LKRLNLILLIIFVPFIILVVLIVSINNPNLDFISSKTMITNIISPVLLFAGLIYWVYNWYKIKNCKKTENLEDDGNDKREE
jgi:hypothetical protein